MDTSLEHFPFSPGKFSLGSNDRFLTLEHVRERYPQNFKERKPFPLQWNGQTIKTDEAVSFFHLNIFGRHLATRCLFLMSRSLLLVLFASFFQDANLSKKRMKPLDIFFFLHFFCLIKYRFRMMDSWLENETTTSVYPYCTLELEALVGYRRERSLQKKAHVA